MYGGRLRLVTQESDGLGYPLFDSLRRLHRSRRRQRLRTPLGSPAMGAARIGRVVFDEAHSEAWTIRPELARTMQPSHPEDSSYALAASALAEREFDVAANV